MSAGLQLVLCVLSALLVHECYCKECPGGTYGEKCFAPSIAATGATQKMEAATASTTDGNRTAQIAEIFKRILTEVTCVYVQATELTTNDLMAGAVTVFHALNDSVECDIGRHGTACEYFCHPNCFENICNKSSGVCERCYGNRQGGNCSECPEKLYGRKCEYTCSKKCAKQICNVDNGTCLSCNDGYRGENCSAVEETWMSYVLLASVLICTGLLIACYFIEKLIKQHKRIVDVEPESVNVVVDSLTTAATTSTTSDDNNT